MPPEPSPPPAARFAGADAPLVALALWTDCRLPLHELVRVLAEEGRGRTRASFAELADRLENGEGPEQAFAAVRGRMPRRVRRQLSLAAESGDLRTALPAMAADLTVGDDLRGRLVASLLYPGLLGGASAAVAVFAATMLVPTFAALYREFDLELPALTELVIAVAHWTPVVVGGTLAAGGLLLALGATPRVSRFVHWLATSPPILGRLWVWSGHRTACLQLAAYAAARTPMPAAVCGVAAGLFDRNLARALRRVGDACERGVPLADAMSRSVHLEPVLAAAVRDGERRGDLAEALAEAGHAYGEQIEQQLALLRRVAPPLMVLLIGGGAILMVAALLIPLVSLIEGLT